MNLHTVQQPSVVVQQTGTSLLASGNKERIINLDSLPFPSIFQLSPNDVLFEKKVEFSSLNLKMGHR